MRHRTAVLVVIFGLLLVALGLARYIVALDRQEQEQAALDRHWNEVQRQAARQFPRALPGEERPAPAVLRGLPTVFGLLGVGGVLVVGGLAGLLRLPRADTETAGDNGSCSDRR